MKRPRRLPKLDDSYVSEPGPKSISRIEQANQKLAVTWLRLVLPSKSKVFHVPNGGYRRPVEAKILQGMGVLAGIPDVICLVPGPRALLFEFKAPGEDPRPNQLQIHRDLTSLGFDVGVVETLDDCRRCLRSWKVPFREAYREHE